jgi:hypothetical protein
MEREFLRWGVGNRGYFSVWEGDIAYDLSGLE